MSASAQLYAQDKLREEIMRSLGPVINSMIDSRAQQASENGLDVETVLREATQDPQAESLFSTDDPNLYSLDSGMEDRSEEDGTSFEMLTARTRMTCSLDCISQDRVKEFVREGQALFPLPTDPGYNEAVNALDVVA